jgi:hypothetical protein
MEEDKEEEARGKIGNFDFLAWSVGQQQALQKQDSHLLP